MKTTLAARIACPFLLGLLGPSAWCQAGEATVGLAERPAARARALAHLSGFVENKGQWPDEVLFHASYGGVEATLTQDALVFRPTPSRDELAAIPPLVLHLPGGPSSCVEGVQAGFTRHHFILASGMASDALGYETVVYRDLVPGIDVRVRMDSSGFAYDLLVDPGARLEDFVIEVGAGPALESIANQRLAIRTGSAVVEQRIGACWQVEPSSGLHEELACNFRNFTAVGGGPRFGFEAPGWDRTKSLVLDPSLIYATYVGGSPPETFKDITVDDSGSAYILCRTIAGTPTTVGAYQPVAPSPFANIWVGKLSPDGSQLEWATFLGGSDSQRPEDIVVDVDGSVVVLGTTWSNDFPTTPGSLQPQTASPGLADVTITRLDPTGSSLIWSTYFGGTDQDLGTKIALFPTGDLLVATDSSSLDVSATAGAFDTVHDSNDKLILGLSSDGTRLTFATFFHTNKIMGVAVDTSSDIFLCGGVFDSLALFPTTPGAFQEVMVPGDSLDGFLSKMNSTGSQLIWSTFLGGSEGSDVVWSVAVDAAFAVYVVGGTSSDNFPVTTGAFSTSLAGVADGFVTKLLPDGSGLVWSTHIGAPIGGSHASDLEVDAAGNVHAAATSNYPGWPTTPDALQPTFIGPFPEGDATLTKFDAFGESLVYSTYFAGTGTDYETRIGMDGSGNPYLAAYTSSVDIPTTPGAYQPSKTPGGNNDIMVAAFDLPLAPWRVLGNGLAGSKAPNIAGGGPLTPGSLARLSLRGGVPGATAWVVVGFTAIEFPIAGGILHPALDVVVPVPLDAMGAFDINVPWPSFSPDVFIQVWSPDAGGPFGWNASNALKAIGG